MGKKLLNIKNNLFFKNGNNYGQLKFICIGSMLTASGNIVAATDAKFLFINNTISHLKQKISLPENERFIAINNIIHNDEPEQNDNLLNKTHFIDPENGDFHLKPTSSYIDAGSNENIAYTETDLDGNPRIANGIVDMGAYEFTTNRTHPADTNQNWVIESDEFSAYNNAWKNAENWPVEPAVIPSEYLTRCGFLLKKGGRYKDVGLNRPLCWMPDN